MKSGYICLNSIIGRKNSKIFNSPVAQIQTSLLIPVSQNMKTWSFELHNRSSGKGSDRILAWGDLDITKLFLIVNKSFSHGLMLNGVVGAKILIEIKFLSSVFIRNPAGIIKLEFIDVF